MLAMALCATALTAGPAQAARFNLIDTGGAGVGTQARAGFDIAAAYWSSVLTNDVTINLNIGFRTLGTGILGSAGSTRTLLSMQAGYDALAANRTSALDFQAVGSLQPLGTSTSITGAGAVTAITNAFAPDGRGYTDSATRIDNDGSVNNSTLAINQTTAKAMGLTTNVNGQAIDYSAIDGNITFSDAFQFDFDPTDGILSTAFDFIGVAIHEIGHVLGFTSGVDSYDAFTNRPATAPVQNLEGFVVMNSLDLFRYRGEGQLDWSTSDEDKYFSIDGGRSQLFGDSRFSTGRANGDGQQASHWKDSPRGIDQIGIMDPTSGRGQMQDVTALDLAAYDAIGWNVSFDVLANSGYRVGTDDIFRQFAAVPEPETWATMIVGFGMIGFGMRQGKRRTTPTVSA